MKEITLSFCFIFLTVTCSSAEENYINYHKKITDAEVAILDSNYKKASIIYYELFNEYEFVFLSNCVTACETAIVIQNDTLAFQFLEKGVKQGLKLDFIEKHINLQQLVYKSQWDQFKGKYDSLRNIYLSSINQELRLKINKLFERDKKWRDMHETHPWNFIWRPFIKIKWNCELKIIVEEELNPLIYEYGYPGERLIGVDEQHMNSGFSSNHINSFMVRLILIHYYSKSRKCNESIYINEIEKGNLHPKHYAEFYDFVAEYSNKKSRFKNKFLCQWHYSEKTIKKTTIEEVNQRRNKIGLGTYQERILEYNLMLNSNKNKRNSTNIPFVNIYY